jgi:hypothetical protein
MSKVSDMSEWAWFAGQALNGLLSGPECPAQQPNESAEQWADRVAALAFELADAMNRARGTRMHTGRSSLP